MAPDGSAPPSSTKSLMLESLSATHSAPGYCWAGGAAVGRERRHPGVPTHPNPPPTPPQHPPHPGAPGQPTCGCSCSCAGAGHRRPPRTPSSAGSAGLGSWPRPPGSSAGTPSGHPAGQCHCHPPRHLAHRGLSRAQQGRALPRTLPAARPSPPWYRTTRPCFPAPQQLHRERDGTEGDARDSPAGRTPSPAGTG